jgi:hypothetical protein
LTGAGKVPNHTLSQTSTSPKKENRMNEDNQQNNKIRCAIYARSAMKNPSAIALQIANCKQIAHERGWQIDD